MEFDSAKFQNVMKEIGFNQDRKEEFKSYINKLDRCIMQSFNLDLELKNIDKIVETNNIRIIVGIKKLKSEYDKFTDIERLSILYFIMLHALDNYILINTDIKIKDVENMNRMLEDLGGFFK